jgi:hypothetical protein
MKRITLAIVMFIAISVPGLYTTDDITLAQLLNQFTLQCVPVGNTPLECPEGVELPDCCIASVPPDCIGEEMRSVDFGMACRECGGRVAVALAEGVTPATCTCVQASVCGG